MPDIEKINLDRGKVQPRVCFIDPALLPEWFWLPTAHEISQRGFDYVVPGLHRGDASATIEDGVDTIETTMEKYESQYIVALSRGVEFAVRYLDRLNKSDKLNKVLGWMVISSVGPKGYTVLTQPKDSPILGRHSQAYINGVSLDEHGLEVMDRDTAKNCILDGIEDEQLKTATLNGLIHERPLTKKEIDSVPHVQAGNIPLAWYIGLNDKVDNQDLSALIARESFKVEPTYTEWGHVGPLSHTSQVVEAIIAEIQRASMESKDIPI